MACKKGSENVEDANITFKQAQIREVFLEEVAFEQSLQDFDYMMLEEG